MASSYFSVSPTQGTGTTYVSVYPLDVNQLQRSKVTTLSLSNGSVTRTATIKQKYIPYLELLSGGQNVPVGGGTKRYKVHSEYDFVFRSVPLYVTITDSFGVSYVGGQRIDKSLAEEREFIFTFAPNTTGAERNTHYEGFQMGHYIRTGLAVRYVDISIVQNGSGTGDSIVPSPVALVFDWDDTSAVTKTITITSNVTWSASLANSSYFQIVGSSTGTGNGSITIRAKDVNHLSNTTYNNTLTITGGTASVSIPLTQYYEPAIIMPDSSQSTTIPATGGTRTMQIRSNYVWWIKPNLSWYISTTDYSTGDPYTMPTAASPAQPIGGTGRTFNFTWERNDGNIRSDDIRIGYDRINGTTGQSTSYKEFRQETSLTPVDNVTPSSFTIDADDISTKTAEVRMGASWTATASASWINLETTGGTSGTTSISFYLDQYTNQQASRSGQITINGSSTKIISISQRPAVAPVVYTISISPTGGTASSGVSTTAVVVTASANWNLNSNSSWLKWYNGASSDTEVTGGSAGQTTIYRRVTANTGSSRTGTTTFTCGTASTTYTLTQEAAYTPPATSIEVYPYIFNVPYNSYESYAVSVTATTPWTTSIVGDQGGSWVHIGSMSSGSAGVSTLYFYVDQGSTLYGDRSATIQFFAQGGSTPIAGVYINQEE